MRYNNTMPSFEEILSRNFTKVDENYRVFAQKKSECRMCEIYDQCKQTAQSEGCAVRPTFMFVGEAYGRDEAVQVRPFIGRAGQRLREELRKHKEVFNRENTIMTNVLSCRPKDNSFPKKLKGVGEVYTHWEGNDRKIPVKTNDIASFCCAHWLQEEIKITMPKVIVTLGAVPLRYVVGRDKIGDSRGEWVFLPKYRAWALPTYHPSYVLRCVNDPQNSFVVHLFEQDIAKVAETWHTVVGNDYRMRMGMDDYKRMMALQTLKRHYG
jgi:uracil-DNA glycosylase